VRLVCFGVVFATALAHAMVCWRRNLYSNQISTIANGAFAGLTALQTLYGAGMWVRVVFVAFFLLFAWVYVWGAEGSFPRTYVRPGPFSSRMA
jgi:hypothetical protein